MQITVLSCWHPYPADNGAKLRALAILKALAPDYTLDLVVLDASGGGMRDPGTLAAYCRSITTLAVPAFRAEHSRDFRSYFSAIPRSLVLTDTPEVTELIASRIAEGRCDALLCACADLRAGYYGLKFARRVPVIIDELEPSRYVHAMRIASLPTRARIGLTAWKYQRFIRLLIDQCAGCFLSSKVEESLVRGLVHHSNRMVIVPNGITVETALTPVVRDPRLLVYNGSPTYAPNLDAVRYFAECILPRIHESHPEVEFAVTGETSGVDVASLAERPGVMFTGWLADIRTYVAGSQVCVVPLRHGGGTRLKILEAMATGTPVVATTKAAEGLSVTDGDDILLADSPEDFAQATLRLLTDTNLHERIAAQARQTVALRYDWEVISATLRLECARLLEQWKARDTA